MGSQCSCISNGVTCEYFDVLVRSLAAAFWTICRRSREFFLSDVNSELQQSNHDKMTA